MSYIETMQTRNLPNALDQELDESFLGFSAVAQPGDL